MNTQLDFWFNPEQLQVFKSIYQAVDQKDLIRELTRLYLDFIQNRREGKKDADSHELEDKR